MSSDILKLKNMTFHAYHGVWEEEREIGQRFEVDVELTLETSKAAKSDKLKDTVDLYAVFETVEKVLSGGKFRLLETMAEKIAQDILGQFHIEGILVRVRKPHAPIRGIQDGIEIEIFRSRSSPAS
jgi:dihydroneopterin aldolase